MPMQAPAACEMLRFGDAEAVYGDQVTADEQSGRASTATTAELPRAEEPSEERTGQRELDLAVPPYFDSANGLLGRETVPLPKQRQGLAPRSPSPSPSVVKEETRSQGSEKRLSAAQPGPVADTSPWSSLMGDAPSLIDGSERPPSVDQQAPGSDDTCTPSSLGVERSPAREKTGVDALCDADTATNTDRVLPLPPAPNNRPSHPATLAATPPVPIPIHVLTKTPHHHQRQRRPPDSALGYSAPPTSTAPEVKLSRRQRVARFFRFWKLWVFPRPTVFALGGRELGRNQGQGREGAARKGARGAGKT
ncbi:hypothetical protein BDV95DRAFT_619523 [Massariosphaeria phaeospora]|uniref:Uncharacterized protein n=1 Tax=Massariosphaeria phaeospora TaxID=100035 RepID=A0A7C8M8R5_9PLEO|nr:hypothetical protein BDV95DRAFT_619523 [Massariosphaeria phaeospora]